MRTIQKFSLEIKPMQDIHGPIDRIIYVGLDCKGQPCIYAEVDTSDVSYGATVFLIRAGEPIPRNGLYKGTILMHNAWHVYM